MASVDRTLIVGGGVAGLTLAAALHRRGFGAELIERSTCWNAVGAGMSVQANAMRVLRALGMDADVEHAGTVLRRWGFCDQQGEILFEWVKQEEWYTGRVLLIGDAAHASSPMMGQGGCMAMEDAYVLAEVLRSAATVEDALDAYVTRRRPRVKWVQQQSRAVSESIRLSPEIRDAALRARGEEMFGRRFRPLIAVP